MSDLSSYPIKKTRKSHLCEWCDELLAPGSPAHYRAYIFDGGFGHGWMHPECWDAMARIDVDLLEEGWMPGDFPRGSEIPHDT